MPTPFPPAPDALTPPARTTARPALRHRVGWLHHALLATVAATLALVVGAAPAAAHDRLVGSDPAAGAELAGAPAQVALEFSSDVLPISPQVRVSDAAGTTVAEGAPTVEGARVTAPLPADLSPGTYTVRWRVVSGDGHPVEGDFAFTVAEPDPATDPATTPSPGTPSPGTPSPGTPSPTAGVTGPAAGPAEDPAAPGAGLSTGARIALGVAALAAAAAVVTGVWTRSRRRGPSGPPA